MSIVPYAWFFETQESEGDFDLSMFTEPVQIEGLLNDFMYLLPIVI